MSQNRSHAVMSQRIEPPDSLDYFPTPPWATRALCRWLEGNIGCLDKLRAWDPACGECDMARPLAEFFRIVEASDVHDYSIARGKEQYRVADFLLEWDRPPHHAKVPPDWIITNPPFRLGREFAIEGLRSAKAGCALLTRIAFLEGGARFRELFSVQPPAAILQFVERVPMHKGRLDPKGVTATAYCWIVWRKDHSGPTQFDWLAPCRKQLERAEDYAFGEASAA